LKIIIFIENNQHGGLDTFCSLLLNNWPSRQDDFVLISNSSHPGQEILQSSIKASCEFASHNIPLSWVWSIYLFGWLPVSLRRITQPFLRILFFPLQFQTLRRLFQRYGGDQLLVLNGGFPGGETCRIANIAWASIGRKHGIHNFHNFAIKPRVGFRWFENWIDRRLEASTSHFVSVSEVCAESLRIRETFRTSDAISYIYNGVDQKFCDDSNVPDLRKVLDIGDEPLCLILANYESRKGHRFLFEVFNMVNKVLPDVHLVACGGGNLDEVEAVKLLSRELAPQSTIHVLNFIPNGHCLIEQADIVVISSQEFESFGLTAAEAMFRSVPVVSTNVGGLPEVIGPDGEGGFTVESNDVDGFAQHIIDLISNSDMRTNVGEQGQQRAKQLFDANRMAKEYHNLIVSTLEAPSAEEL
jgi:L-malate glycosyltransferase